MRLAEKREKAPSVLVGRRGANIGEKIKNKEWETGRTQAERKTVVNRPKHSIRNRIAGSQAPFHHWGS